MRFLILIFGVFYSHVLYQARASKVCYEAKTCIHNGREKCGVDTKGEVRRFLDTCDIHEYNCLKGTDYVKTDREKCDSLPPLESPVSSENNAHEENATHENIEKQVEKGNYENEHVDVKDGGKVESVEETPPTPTEGSE